jgi:DNA polymerase-3 subunit epsilon
MPNEVVDTLAIAREQFPGSQVSLDALCRRFEVDLSDRTFHGALLDAQLLAAVYLELTGGQQPILSLDDDADDDGVDSSKYKKTLARAPRGFSASAEELAAHQAFIDKIQGNMW